MSCFSNASQWSDWLCELGREGKIVTDVGVPRAMRGFRWGMSIALEGDYTDHLLIGRVKTAPDAPDVVAVMDVFGPVLHEGSTLWELTIPAAETASMPAPVGGNGVAKFLFMLILVPPEPAAPYPLVASEFTLLGAL